MDVFIGCGVAGAISAGFGAPIAGIVFAHEAIIKHFSLRAIAPIAISSITASAMGQYLFGSRQLFQLNFAPPELISSLPFLIGCGIVFGLVAVLFMVSVRFLFQLAKNLAFRSRSSPFLQRWYAVAWAWYFRKFSAWGRRR